MRQQFLKEWGKLVHAWSVRLTFLLFLAGAVIAAVSSDCTAYMAPFTGCSYWGNMSTILLAVLVAGQVAGEYQNGRAAKAAAETERRDYFAAKVMGLFSLSAFLCLFYMAVLSLLCFIKNGMGRGYFFHYPLQVMVVLFCKILTYWVYIAVFLLIGVLVRRRFLSFALSFGVMFLEVFLYTRLQMERPVSVAGPWTALMQLDRYIGRGDFLSYDFYFLFVPGVSVGVLALVIGYHVFRRGKMQTKSGRKPGGLLAGFAGIAKGAVMVAVMFLVCGQAGSLAEERAASMENQPSVENVGEMRLVYGDGSLEDGEAFVLLLMAEGFTRNQQEDFFRGVENLASGLMGISPYDEFADVTKIYALGTMSVESGIRGDGAANWEQAKQDSRDTFFGVSFWGEGQDWKLGLSMEGFRKIDDLRQQFLPAADFCGIIINSGAARGTTYYDRPSGVTVLATLDKVTLPHELAHAVAGLADEYDQKGYYNSFFEAPNLTEEKDPRKVPWAGYLGMDDISVYECAYDSRWCHPSMTCIMRDPRTGRFCRVCEDALREKLCRYCGVDRLLFGSCGRQIFESGTGTDMRKYFKVWNGTEILEGSQIPGEFLRLEYFDGDGRVLEGLPGRAGTYFVEARFSGYGTEGMVCEPCSLKVSYEIKQSPAKVFWLSVAPLIAGTAVWGAGRVAGDRRGRGFRK